MIAKAHVLVVARDATLGELIAAYVEAAGGQPVFPAHDESPLGAITRLRPRLILLDCDGDLVWEDDAHRRAAEVGARVLLFSATHTAREAAVIGQRWRAPVVALPIAPKDFAQKGDDALSA